MNTLSRRGFVNHLGVGALTTAFAVGQSSSVQGKDVPSSSLATNADEWLNGVKGTHRIVYDAPEPHNGFPVIWTWVFYQTNNQTGSNDNDQTAMVILRHNAIPLAMEDRLWQKYPLGEVFNIQDAKTKSPAKRNVYYAPQEGDFPVKEIQGIKDLQQRGAMFCVCDMALTVIGGMVAQKMNLKPEDVKKDWVSGILPGIQIVPSGVWAVARAQKKGCAYCYAGG